MKRYLAVLGIAITVCLIISCKKSTPNPSTSNGTTGTTTGTTTGGTTTGTTTTHGFNFDATYKSTGTFATMSALQADGKLVIGNNTQIARLNADGSLDNSFTVGNATNGKFESLALQPDGKILVGGSFTSYNTQTKNNLVRLNTDGTLDNSFLSSFIVLPATYGNTNDINTIALQTDGKILLGGGFLYVTHTDGTTSSGVSNLVRLNADGSYDATFQHQLYCNGVFCVKIAGDNKIYVTGAAIREDYFPTKNSTGVGYNYIIRLNTDGSLDPNFRWRTDIFKMDDTYSNLTPFGRTITVDDNGKILLGGRFDQTSNVISDSYGGIVRLNTDGSIDNTLPRYGYGEIVTSIAVLSDKIVYTRMYDPSKTHFNAVGAIIIANKDWSTTSLLLTSTYTYGDAYNVVEDANKNLIVVGQLFTVPVSQPVAYKGIVHFVKY